MNYSDPPESSYPEPPDSLSSMARQEWDLVRIQVEHFGYMLPMDAPLLTIYCDLLAAFLKNPLEFSVGNLANLWAMAEELYLTDHLKEKAPALGKVPDGEGGYLEWHDESLMRD